MTMLGSAVGGGGLVHFTLVPSVYVTGLHSVPVSQSYAFLPSSLTLTGGCQATDEGFTTSQIGRTHTVAPCLLQSYSTTPPLHQLTDSSYNTSLHQLTDSSYNTSLHQLTDTAHCTSVQHTPITRQVCSGNVKDRCEDKDEDKEEREEEEERVYDKHCKVCGVSMNAQAQAKQHYEGRSHARRLKMYVLGRHIDDVTGTESDNKACQSQTGGKVETPVTSSTSVTKQSDIDPDIYCKVCIVSFNSPKQAAQHYRGKAHARRVRSMARRRQTRDRYTTRHQLTALHSAITMSESVPLQYMSVRQAVYLNSVLR